MSHEWVTLIMGLGIGFNLGAMTVGLILVLLKAMRSEVE